MKERRFSWVPSQYRFQKWNICFAVVMIWCCFLTSTKSSYFSCLEREGTCILWNACISRTVGKPDLVNILHQLVCQAVLTKYWTVDFPVTIINYKKQIWMLWFTGDTITSWCLKHYIFIVISLSVVPFSHWSLYFLFLSFSHWSLIFEMIKNSKGLIRLNFGLNSSM